MLEWTTAADWDAFANRRNVIHANYPGYTADTLRLGHPALDTETDLQAYWMPADGGQYTDVWNGFTGNVTGATFDANGGINSTPAYIYDATDDYTNHGYTPPTDTPWAFEVWLRPHTFQDMEIMGNWDGSNSLEIKVDTTGGHVSFFTYGSSGVEGATDRDIGLQTGVLQHLGCQYVPADNEFQIWRNGQSEASNTGQAWEPGTNTPYLGAKNDDGAVANVFDGRIARARVYHRNLDGSEWQKRYEAALQGYLTTDSRQSSTSIGVLNSTVSLNGDSVTVTVHEDTNGDGTSDYSETVSPPDGDQETRLDVIPGQSGSEYWLDVDLDADAVATSPVVHRLALARSQGNVINTTSNGVLETTSEGVLATTQ